MPKQVAYGSLARKKLIAGANKLADATCVTLGPRGKNVIIENGELPFVTKDGVTVAKKFSLEDPIERMGADIVRQAASKSNENVGDGTTTSTLLAREIINACEKELKENPSRDVHQLVKEMREYGERVCSYLDTLKKDVKSLKDLKSVAIISANNDEETGNLVAELVHKIGKNGVVTVEESQGTKTETEYVEGTQIPHGFASPYMATNEKGECVMNDAPLLVTDRRISSISDLLPLLKQLHEAGNNKLLILAEEVEGDALATLVVNKVRVGFQSLAVKAPLYGKYKTDSLKDLAALFGAVFISDEEGRKLDKVKLTDLGLVKKAVSTKDKTTLIGGDQKKPEVQARIEELKEDIKNEKNTFDKEKKQERLARLTSGVALIRVGGYTEAEMKEKKYLIEDAVCATKAALESGILPGGGVALLRASQNVDPCFIYKSLESPIKAITENSGHKDVLTQIKSNPKDSYGFDAKEGSFKDMMEAGIVDPTDVVKNEVLNAISVACTFLSTEAVLFDKPDKK